MTETQLAVASTSHTVIVRVIGRGDFLPAQDLKTYSNKLLNSSSQELENIVIELSGCETMDSTFMGILAMIGIQGRSRFKLTILNASPKLHQLLSEIGVDRLWKFAESDINTQSWDIIHQALSRNVPDDKLIGKTVLEAHETLMNLDKANIPKFQNVVDLLKTQLGN